MSWNNDRRVIEHAVNTMKRQGVLVSPDRVERVYNAVQRSKQATATPGERLMAELRESGNERVIASVNTETGAIGGVCLAPTTIVNEDDEGFRLNAARRAAWEQRLAALKAIASDPRSSMPARKRAEIEAMRIEKLLRAG